MKKTVAKILCVAILAIALMGALVSCNSDLFLKKLKVRQFGDLLVWDGIKNAEIYEIYQNGEVLDTTFNTYYRVPENKEDQVYTVRAKKGEDTNASKMSNEIKVARNVFNKKEILKVDLSKQSGKIIITDDIKNVQVSGSSGSACFVIENRVDDLFISMKNVRMTAPHDMSCIQYGEMPSDHTPQFTTCIEFDGNCSLCAGDITYVPPQQATGSKKAGTPGTNGVAGINLAKMVIYGEGNLSVRGGTGGTGGKGANSSWSHMQGAGSRGGTGGTGIACTECCVVFTGEISTAGGIGGKGGTYGDGNANLGGTLGMFLVSEKEYYGYQGYDGVKVSGTFNVFAGAVDWD